MVTHAPLSFPGLFLLEPMTDSGPISTDSRHGKSVWVVAHAAGLSKRPSPVLTVLATVQYYSGLRFESWNTSFPIRGGQTRRQARRTRIGRSKSLGSTFRVGKPSGSEIRIKYLTTFRSNFPAFTYVLSAESRSKAESGRNRTSVVVCHPPIT